MSKRPHFGDCDEDAPAHIYAQIIAGLTPAVITQASVSSATYRVDQYDSRDDAVMQAGGTEITDDTALTTSAVFFNSLQTSGVGAEMVTSYGTGYNFAATIPAASFPTGGKWYSVELWVTPSSGEAYRGGWWVLECQGTAKS